MAKLKKKKQLSVYFLVQNHFPFLSPSNAGFNDSPGTGNYTTLNCPKSKCDSIAI